MPPVRWRRAVVAGLLLSALGGLSAPAVAVAQAPTIAESFADQHIALAAKTTLTFTITSTDAPAPHAVSFDDTLPAGLQVSGTPSTDCTGVPGSGGAQDINFNGPAVIEASCTISATVKGVQAGHQDNPVTVTIDGSSSDIDASIDVVAPPSLTKAFGSPSIPVGGTTSVTFTLVNPNTTVQLTGVGFTDNLPAGLAVAQTPNPTDGCGGNLTDNSGAGSISLSGASIAAGQTCTIALDVTGTQAGTQNNTTGPVSSNEGGAGAPATASITVTNNVPTVSDGFGQSSIPVGAGTTLSFMVTNPAGNATITGVGFTDTLPGGLTISAPNGQSSSCTSGASTPGTLTATQATQAISLTGASIAGGESCTYTINVTGTQAGSLTNTPGSLTDDQADSISFPSAAITVVPDAPPTIANAFAPGDIRLGGTSQLTFTITNPAANPAAATGVRFDDTLPAGLTVPSGSAPACGGTLSTTSPGGISLSGGTLQPGGQCQLSVTVTGAADGNYVDDTGPASSNEGGAGGGSSAHITVAAPPSIASSFGPALVGGGNTTTLSFTITSPNANVPLSGVGFTDILPAGLSVGTPNGATNSCGGSVSAAPGSQTIALVGGTVAPRSSCAVSVSVLANATGRVFTASSAVGSTEGGAGNSASASVTVVAAPTVSVTSPTAGASYRAGQKVPANYSCADDPNGPGISSCSGSVPNGALIDTSKLGQHIFTVIAVSKDGGRSSDLVFYTVGPSNRFKMLNVRVHPDGSVDYRVKVPGRGRIEVLETVSVRPAPAPDAQLQPRRGQFVFARGTMAAARAGKVHLEIRPNARGRLAVQRRRNLRVSVVVGYTPKGGARWTVRFKFTVPS